METSEDLDKKIIQNLATLLRKNGDKILSGESKFCLTTGSIVTLNASFHRCSSLNLESEEQPKQQAWRDDVHLLFDFVRKTVALKVIHGTCTIRAPIQISRFRNLQSLEVKKVPIHMLEGLQILRGQLVTLTISKSLQTLKDLFEVCGGDRSSGMSWECLKFAFLSFNNIIKLDESLRLVQALEVLDLSHNSIWIELDNKCLEYLTDTRRINLGYNCLTLVPTFSYSVKSQLKTLILRSNSLDSLAGVEELSSLEELDVADNLLSDHSCLKAITKLHRLYILCLQGNPIFFHNNHRSLALQYISASCDLVKMVLNGHRLSATEVMDLVKLRDSNKPLSSVGLCTAVCETVLEHMYQSNNGRLSDDNFVVITIEDVDGRSTNSSQGNMSPSKSYSSQRTRRKKKGQIRRRSRDNIIISDLDTSATEYSSSLGSRTSSPTGSLTEGIGTDDILEEKKRIEILRKHYGNDWLRAFSAEKYGPPKRQEETNDRNKLDQSYIPRDVENEKLKITDVPRKTQDMQTKASDVPGITQDIQTKIPDVNRTLDGTLHQDHANRREEEKVDVESHQGQSSDSRQEVQKSNFLTDIYASADTINTWDSTEEPSVRNVLTKQETLAGFEWTRTPSQQEELYGEESEPFIVMLPDNKLETIIVTLNDRYIIEKRVDLTVSEKLDIKSLQNYRRVDHVAKNQNVEVDITFPTLHLKFDSVNKRKRERFYAMEDNTYAEQFMALLTERLHKLRAASDTKSRLLYECYICSYQFYNDEPSFKAKESKPQKCPKCMGKMIFKVSTKDVPDGAILPTTATQKIASANVIKKETQLLKKEPDQMNPPVLRRQKNIKKKRHEECDQDSVMEDDISTQHPIHPAPNLIGSNLRGEQPSSDSGKSAQDSQKRSNSGLDINRPAISTFQTSRNSVSSVESDILVLNTSNKGDVETISEVIDVSTLNEKMEDETVFHSFFKKESGQLPRLQISLNGSTSSLPSKTAILRGSSGSNVIPGETTPVGSPLSSSICSSMVSSVYENTLPGNKSSPTGEDVGGEPSPVSSDDLLTLRKSSSESPENRYRDSKDEHIQRQEGIRRGTYINKRCATMIDIDFDLQKLNLDEDQGQGQDQAAGKKYQDSMPGSLYCETNGKDSEGHNDSGTVYFTANNTPIKSDSGQKPGVSIYGSSGFISQKDIVDENDSSILVTTDIPALKRDKKMAFKMHGMYTEQTDESDIVSVEVKNKTNGTDYSKSVESAESSKGGKSAGANNSVDYSYFTNINHNLQLYLELKLFDGEEKCQGVLECDIVQYMNPDEFPGLMVLTSSRILIYKVIGDRNSCDLDVDSDWLRCIDNQPITELQYIDIGMGYQSLRLEFGTECSSFTFIIRDEKRCQNFLSFFTGIVQSSTFSEHSMLQGITKNNPTTVSNLQKYVLQLLEEGEDVVEGGEGKQGATLVKYLTSCFQEDKDAAEDTDNVKKAIRSIVITYSHICLVKQNYQWPLPRLQAPLDSSLMGKEFELLQKERINNIESFEVNEEDPTQLRISFFNEDSEAKVRWIISIATLDGVQSLVSAIKDPWEQEFGVSLDVTEVTFQED